MIISNSRQFTFIHIHKTGGTSLERAVDPYLAWNDVILGGSKFGERVQPAYSKKFGLNKHSSVSEIEETCGSRYIDDYYTFSLVRHPVSRLCSVYNFVAGLLNTWAVQQQISLEDVSRHITRDAARNKPSLGWVSSRVFTETKTFSEFIRHDDLVRAPGVRTQVSCLLGRGSDKLKAEFFRIEDQLTWVDPLSDRLGIKIALPHANKSGLTLISEESVLPADRDYIRSWFRADYDAFGYSP